MPFWGWAALYGEKNAKNKHVLICLAWTKTFIFSSPLCSISDVTADKILCVCDRTPLHKMAILSLSKTRMNKWTGSNGSILTTSSVFHTSLSYCEEHQLKMWWGRLTSWLFLCSKLKCYPHMHICIHIKIGRHLTTHVLQPPALKGLQKKLILRATALSASTIDMMRWRSHTHRNTYALLNDSPDEMLSFNWPTVEVDVTQMDNGKSITILCCREWTWEIQRWWGFWRVKET